MFGKWQRLLSVTLQTSPANVVLPQNRIRNTPSADAKLQKITFSGSWRLESKTALKV